jgi:hypothetical protein
MPYIRCPGCALDSYSAAGHSTTDACPRCGATLSGGVRETAIDAVVVLRPRLFDPASDPEAGATPPSAAP